MIILVSDLHLADTPARKTINLISLLRRMRLEVELARTNGVGSATIVLLGDIFEILKSSKWLESGARPWDERVTHRHVDTVSAIFESIVECNMDFFTRLNELVGEYRFSKLVYVPGNHDRPLNTRMGVGARERLRTLLPFGIAKGRRFDDIFRSNDHLLTARHGHEYDSTNRYTDRGAAIGDVVVVDILLRLPQLMAESLGLDEYDKRLLFLHELDNVRPPGARFMAQWMLGGIASLEDEGVDAAKALERTFTVLLDELDGVLHETVFETPRLLRWWMSFFRWTKPLLRRFGAVRALEMAIDRTTPDFEGPGAQGESAIARTALTAQRASTRMRYFVCGHTHNPLIVPVDHESTRRADAPLYLNTGTWRRVHRAADVYDRESGLTSFSAWEEECLVTVYSPADRKANDLLPAYEFHRVTRGANS